ncbi:MAG: sigma-70 family RNA polymerase sigma factor, partial [Pelolinea sp.]|nr:sigma-70 family RNA polymerase sigma factor [Pelolinea sp.]
MVDESTLINNAKKGDVESFNRLVLTYQEQVFNLTFRMLNDEMAAEDASQNTFISAYKNIRSFRGGSFRAWLLRIAANNCYDEFRRKKSKPTQPLSVFDDESGEEIEDPIWLEDKDSLPEQDFEQKELEQAIQLCIDRLPEQFKVAVILVDVQGLGYKEASQVISSPIGTIRSRLARARQQLQECLQGFWEHLP